MPERTTRQLEDLPKVEIGLEELSEPVDWSAFFGRKGLLDVEIGVGRDTFLIEFGKRNRDKLLLGIDYSNERIKRLGKKVEREGVSSIRLLCCEAMQAIARFMSPGEVENFYIFFSDPWPKKCHRKNRVVSRASARLFATRLVPGGKIFLKTDDPDLFRDMKEVLEKISFLRNFYGPGQQADLNELLPHQTLYEHKWIKKGKEIYSLLYIRTEDP